MKGIKYNLIFQKPNETKETYNLLNMKELIETIKNNFKNNYFLDININNQIVYNLLKRPLTVNKLFRQKLKIEKITI